MTRFNWRLCLYCALVLAAPAGARAEEVPVYPHAAYDEALSRKSVDAAKQFGLGDNSARSAAYLTADPFEAVLAFYRGVAREYPMPGRSPDHRLVLPAEIVPGPGGVAEHPSDVTVRQAFFILDGAPDLSTSHQWLMIARPIVGRMGVERQARNGLRFSYGDLRQVTAITYIEIRR